MRPITHILCPVDFSEKSHETVKKAGFLARLYQADLTLVHVISSLSQYMGTTYGFDSATNPEWFLPMTEQAKEKSREMLREIKQKHIPYAVKCKSSVRYGRVSEEILAEAKETNTDMIVMSMDSRDDLISRSFGNVVTDVVSHSPCPTLVFHQILEEKGFNKILIPVDISFGADELCDYLVEYFSVRDPEVVIMTVVEQIENEGYVGRIKAYLEGFAHKLRAANVENVSVQVIGGKNIASAINDFAVAGNFQLVMMNTHAKSGLGGWVMGSVTHSVITRSRVPIFTYRAAKIAEMTEQN